MLCKHFVNIQVDGWAALPNIPCHGPVHFAALNIFLFWCYADFQQRSNERLVVLPPNTVQFILRCWVNFSSGWHEAFYKHSKFWMGRAPPNTVQFYSQCWKTFSSECYAAFQKLSSWWLGRAPQHSLSRPSSFHGLKQSFLLDVMQTFNSAQMNGWSCSPKHDPAHITVLSQLFVRMAWRFSKTFKFQAGSCSPKHGRVPFTVLKNFFVWIICNLFKNIQSDGWAALPNIPCHGPNYFAALTYVFFWCYADFQQRSNERLVVLPQTRSSSNHAVESTFRPDGVKLFKNIPILSWVVLPQTRPSSFHGVEELFRLDVMQFFRKHSSWWLGRAPQHPLSRPNSFRGVDDSFCFDVVPIFNNVQMNGWSCSPKHGPAQFTVLSQLFVRMAWNFSKSVKNLAGSCFFKHGPILFTVLQNLFDWMLCSHLKTFKLIARPRSPTSPVTAQLISRR